VDPDPEGQDLLDLVTYYRSVADEPGEIFLYVDSAGLTAERVNRYQTLGVTWLASDAISPEQSVVANLQAIRRGSPSGPFTCLLPPVDAGVHGILIDLCQLRIREGEVVQGTDVLLQLVHAARADEHRRHPRVAQDPRQRHLREALPAARRDVVQRADVPQCLVGEQVRRQRLALARARALRHTVQIPIGQHALRER